MTIPVTFQGTHAYDVVIDAGALFSYLKTAFLGGALSGFQNRRFLILTDETVAPLYADALRKALAPFAKSTDCMILPAGEQYKTLDEVRRVYDTLIRKSFDRKDLLFALGGGVIGDMTGFIAATYLRGIAFVQLPTTLLSQTDASVGGKCGVDFDGYKNMVGAFHMPRLVVIHPQVLRSLPDREFCSGMAEVIKHGLIRDRDYAARLLREKERILQKDPDILAGVIARSVEIKRDIVEHDPLEQGDRALLNFGHTIGHAIEKASGFTMLHGECVSLGCMAASFLSAKRGLLTEEKVAYIRSLFEAFLLPVRCELPSDPRAILSLIRSDKKMDAGQIRFVLLKDIGDALIDSTVTKEEMLDAIGTLPKTAS